MEHSPPPIPPAIEPEYHQVSVLRYCSMSFLSMGIYRFYWSYKVWAYVKKRDQSSIMPFMRALFAPLFYYPLLLDLDEHQDGVAKFSPGWNGFLALLFLLLNAALRLPDPYWIISLVAFLPQIPAVAYIAKKNAKFSKPKIGFLKAIGTSVVILLGGLSLLVTMLTLAHCIPDTKVIEGSKLWQRDLDFLLASNLLVEEEEVLYFYSTGLLSIQTDGQFLTDLSVASYFVSPGEDLIRGGYFYFEDIMDITTTWSKSWIEQTVVLITDHSGEQLELWLSPEAEGDHLFVDELMKRWKAANP